MEEEFDIRVYIARLLAHAKWILAISITAAIVTLLIFSSRPSLYRATALVVITDPQLLIEFEPSISTVNPALRSLYSSSELATTDSLLLEVLSEVGENQTLEEFRDKIAVEMKKDSNNIWLSVEDEDAGTAAEIANVWATKFIDRANHVYGAQNQEQVAFFEVELEEAEADLREAERGYVDFQTNNRTAIIENELNSYLQEQVENLASQREILLLKQNITGLREQLTNGSESDTSSIADEISALLIQIQVFSQRNNLPIELEISNRDSLIEGKEQQIAKLMSLNEVLDGKLNEINERLAALEPLILTTQHKLEDVRATDRRLSKELEVAQEIYEALKRKTAEARIATEDSNTQFRLASNAVPPVKPKSSQGVLFGLIAGLQAFLISSALVLLMGWWRQGETVPHEDRSQNRKEDQELQLPATS